MKKQGKIQFITGFVLGAVIFGTATAMAAGVIATPSANKMVVNGKSVNVEAYNIDGRNYLQLRDMADIIGFSVDWDSVNGQVIINTANGNIPDNQTKEDINKDIADNDIKPSYDTANIPKGVLEKDYPIWCDENYQPFENELEVIRLVNEERVKVGLNPVTINMGLCKVARIKAEEMVELDYFSHESPNYGSHTDTVKKFDIECKWAGENISRQGGTYASGVMWSWMNSEGHRNHILNPKLKEIGVGVADDGQGFGYWSLFMLY